MKYILFIVFIFTLLSCSSSSSVLEIIKVFTTEEVKSSGFKMWGTFESEFKGSSESMHGFYKGREVPFIVYPTMKH